MWVNERVIAWINARIIVRINAWVNARINERGDNEKQGIFKPVLVKVRN